LTYLAVLLLGLGGFIAWTGHQLQVAVIQQAENDLQIKAHIVAGLLGEAFEDLGEQRRGGANRLAPLVDSYAQTLGVQVVVLDRRLQPVAASEAAASLGDVAGAPEVIAAQERRSDHDRRISATGEERLYAAAAIGEDDDRPRGIVQLSRPTATLNAEIGRLWARLLSAGVVIALGTVLVSVVIARRLAQPIQALTAASTQLAAGDLTQRARPSGPNEIRQLGEAFNRMVSRLEQMLASQRAFVAYAAHELRSPLASVRLRIEMLGTDRARQDPALTRQYIEQIERDLEQLGDLLSQLLTLSALDEAQLPPHTPIDLAPLLYALADEVAPRAHASGLRWGMDIPEHLHPVSGNATQLRMAVRNLLDNAIKYTPAGGSVSITARAEEDALVVSVTDTGIGMSQSQRARVFDRFYRAEGVSAAREAGFGLGLALVQAIVAAHRGMVQVASEPGAGSTFTIRLPLAAAAEPGVSRATSQQDALAGSPRG
jgi:signal transduction histidine kinase